MRREGLVSQPLRCERRKSVLEVEVSGKLPLTRIICLLRNRAEAEEPTASVIVPPLALSSVPGLPNQT